MSTIDTSRIAAPETTNDESDLQIDASHEKNLWFGHLEGWNWSTRMGEGYKGRRDAVQC